MVAEAAPGMGMKNRPLTAIVCDYDPLWLPAAVARVREAGFEVLGDTVSVVDALRWSNYLKPSLVVVTNEHSGLTALQALDDFRQQEHQPEVLVLSTSEVDRHFFIANGALLLAGRFDNDGFDRALAEAKDYLITGERRKNTDRRGTRDRRVAQDWKMVTKERRSGVDRRVEDRRARAEAEALAAAEAEWRKQTVPDTSRVVGLLAATRASERTDHAELHDVFARAIARANAVAAGREA
jgi:hypothetical protein